MPQCAIAQEGSRSTTALKLARASRNSNECSSATPRFKSAATAGVHDVWNDTVPSWLPAACCSCWANIADGMARTKVRTDAIRVIEAPPETATVCAAIGEVTKIYRIQPLRRLVRSKHDVWAEARRSPRWQPAGESAGHDDRCDYRSHSRRIRRLHTKQQRLNQPAHCEGSGNSHDDPDDDELEALAQHLLEHGRTRRSEREADADLEASLGHHIGEHAVGADSGQQQCEGRE